MGIWYKDFYLATPEGEKHLRSAIENPENRADVEKRLGEMRQLSDDRCHITKAQKIFLERVLYGGDHAG